MRDEKSDNDGTGKVRVARLDDAIVTMPGTNYSVTYRKVQSSPWLLASDLRDDPNSPISRHTFRARAWIAANEKARELGWIVSSVIARRPSRSQHAQIYPCSRATPF